MQKTHQHFPKCIVGTHLDCGTQKFSAQSTASAVPGLFRIRLAKIFADVGQVSW